MRGQALFGLSSHIYSLKGAAESSAVKRMNPRWIQNEPPIILVPFYCDAFRRTDASNQHASRIPPVLPASARRTKNTGLQTKSVFRHTAGQSKYVTCKTSHKNAGNRRKFRSQTSDNKRAKGPAECRRRFN